MASMATYYSSFGRAASRLVTSEAQMCASGRTTQDPPPSCAKHLNIRWSRLNMRFPRMTCALLLLRPAEAFLRPHATRVPAPQGSLLGCRSKPLVRTCPCRSNSLQNRGDRGGRQPSSLELKNANAEKDDPVSSGPIKLQVCPTAVYVRIIPVDISTGPSYCCTTGPSYCCTTAPFHYIIKMSHSDTHHCVSLPGVLAARQSLYREYGCCKQCGALQCT